MTDDEQPKTIAQFKKDKRKLEADILQFLQQLQNDYGVRGITISIATIKQSLVNGEHCQIVDVKIRCDL